MNTQAIRTLARCAHSANRMGVHYKRMGMTARAAGWFACAKNHLACARDLKTASARVCI